MLSSQFLLSAPQVSLHPSKTVSENALFSIVIPSWNNLEFLKMCVASLQKNSRYAHQIIIHLNEANDGSRVWVDENNLDYSYSEQNIGICYAMNMARTLVKTEYLVYFNDDMYACPDWDYWLYEEIKEQRDSFFFISSTMIEPRETGNACVIAPFDCGSNLKDFDEQKLLENFEQLEKVDWQGTTWPPSVLPVLLWDMVGGYSTEFSPGMYSDPDFAMKLWQLGVRYFKGVGKSRIYHFMSKSTGKLTFKANGSRMFLNKWGLSSKFFTHHYLRRGEVWTEVLSMPRESIKLKLYRLLNQIKKRLR
ncbi:MAG: glycosyltransferase family 2 protein [Methylococcales bacterium]|nr:glycosyltransferase family 2 protein [Methylococcales bacterium]